MLGDVEALTQRGEISVARRDVFPKARDQRLLEVLSVIQVVDVAQLAGNLGAQPLKLPLVSRGFVAHGDRQADDLRLGKRGGAVTIALRILSEIEPADGGRITWKWRSQTEPIAP
jgi:hypothetical protein